MLGSNELVPSKEKIHEFITGLPSPAFENENLSDSVGILPEEDGFSQHAAGEATTILNDSAASILEFESQVNSTTLDSQLPVAELNEDVFHTAQHDQNNVHSAPESQKTAVDDRYPFTALWRVDWMVVHSASDMIGLSNLLVLMPTRLGHTRTVAQKLQIGVSRSHRGCAETIRIAAANRPQARGVNAYTKIKRTTTSLSICRCMSACSRPCMHTWQGDEGAVTGGGGTARGRPELVSPVLHVHTSSGFCIEQFLISIRMRTGHPSRWTTSGRKIHPWGTRRRTTQTPGHPGGTRTMIFRWWRICSKHSMVRVRGARGGGVEG